MRAPMPCGPGSAAPEATALPIPTSPSLQNFVDVMGPDHIGLGSDHYGLEFAPQGLEDISTLPRILTECPVPAGR